MTATTRAISVTPIDAPVGAEVHGDITAELSGGDIWTLLEAFRERHVLVIKEQPVTDNRLLEIASWFGPQFVPQDDIPVLGTDDQGAVTILSNRDELGVGSRVPLPMHSDFQFLPQPLKGAALHAVTVPPVSAGGNTSWSNLHMALEELDPKLRARIEGVEGIGINPYAGGGKGHGFTGDNQKYIPQAVPDFPHRLIRTHPETGRQTLYFSLFIHKLVGFEDRAEDEADILGALREFCDQDRFYYEHEWSAGDTIIWDNRCTNHKRAAFDQSFEREMHRVQIAGTKPF